MDSALDTSTQPSGVTSTTSKRWCGRKPLHACWRREILLLFFWQVLFTYCHDFAHMDESYHQMFLCL